MYLESIHIKNYRLLADAGINFDKATTIIVGRNNTGKTSLMDLTRKVTHGYKLTFHDYPMKFRDALYLATEQFVNNDITYDELRNCIQSPSIKFVINYDLEKPEQSLGALSPFIIDTDIETTKAVILAEYRFSISADAFKELFVIESDSDGNASKMSREFVQKTIKKSFPQFFELVIEAINPNDVTDKQPKTHNDLGELLPVHIIKAERGMDESELANQNPLRPILSRLFKMDIEEIYPEVQDEARKLRSLVEKTNETIEENTNKLLADIVKKSLDFGYPSSEEMQLKAITQIALEDQIKSNTDLAYIEQGFLEELPSTYNGLGYKNLIKIEFELAEFSKQIESRVEVAIPLLFIEEPESHMHPQLQQAFAKFLTAFLKKLSGKPIQILMTTHSSHIANAVPFNQIRYVRKCKNFVEYKDLSVFYTANKPNADFIHKYLTLNRCDLFFADKAILIEGTAERLLIPDMINKCGDGGLYTSEAPQLSSQYYSLIEVGGAYAHIFCPFLDFLGIPTLIITDIDSVADNLSKTLVSAGTKSSNATIKWWVRRALGMNEDAPVSLSAIVTLEEMKKTHGICHIEFQTCESGICGRSLEEAIINVNRALYAIGENPKEEDVCFSGKKKTDFALELLLEKSNYNVPAYIQNGLCWLDEQKLFST